MSPKFDLTNDIKFKNIINNFENYFKKICEIIGLDEKWSPKNSYDIEIKKSFVRGLLRYLEDFFY